MKTLALTGIAILAFSLVALAQGVIDLDDSTNANGVAISTAGNYYFGTFGMEVWELSGATSVPPGINIAPASGSGIAAYNAMVAAGFKKQATFVNQAMSPPGTFTLGDLTMPDVTPAGSTVVLALAVWNTSASSWAGMLSNANENTAGGVLAFLNPTTNPGISPTPEPASLSGWTSGDLVMTKTLNVPPTKLYGSLVVLIRPPSVVSAGAQWQVDGGAWQDSGATVYPLLMGTHTVAFSTVTGWTRPRSQTVTVYYYYGDSTVATYMESVVGGFGYTTNSGTITITGYTGPDGDATIPSTINGLPVTSIADYAFGWCTGLTGVTIPDSVASIGDDAFNYCTSLSNVIIGDGVTNIGGSAFFDCSLLTNVMIGANVTSIGDDAFCNTGLTSVTIPDSVTSIGDFAFSTTGLTNVMIGDSVTSIGDDAFCNTGLTSVTIPDSVTSIGDYAFGWCTGLTSVTIPDSVRSIGANAFLGCTNLVSVTIGNGVASIGDFAFDCGANLMRVYFQGNAPGLGEAVFDWDYNTTVYYLPGTTGWGTTFGSCPTKLWNPHVETSDASFGVLDNQFGFTITGNSGLVVVVEANTNLANPLWWPVGTNTLSGGSSYFSDPQSTKYPARFYRLRTP